MFRSDIKNVLGDIESVLRDIAGGRDEFSVVP